MKKLYLHAGFGKCGSSSIQAFLSRYEKFKCENGNDMVYAALTNDRRVLYGKELTQLAGQNHSGSITSIPFPLMKPSPEEYFNAVGDQLIGLLEKNHVVLSQESWSNKKAEWDGISFFQNNKLEVDFIIYIRPPVTRVNSSWWQWGAWANQELDDWVAQSVSAVKYEKKIRQLNGLSWVNRVHVRLLDNNLLDDFSSVIRLDKQVHQAPHAMANKSLPNGILRLFQTHKRLRPSPHASAIDFILEKHLKLEGEADWVLDPAHIKTIIEETRDSNLALLDFIDEDCKGKFIADQRYWDAAAFDDKVAQPTGGIKPSYEELEGIALAGIDAVMDLATQQMAKSPAGPSFNQSDIWRDLALHVEKADIELAYRLLQQADKLCPGTPHIQKKLAQYKTALDAM
ncbi:hypothetical protein [Methylovulum miyakonense]|uniref:hypothetical protein n=1 Tax=Methylovulum miyakonense TaxID=645578 RepID=UPI0003687284|nr:hypothetical protein [Methylovulum miyakonense]